VSCRRICEAGVVDVRAMASPLLWLEALAGLKALYDLTQGAKEYVERLRFHRAEESTIVESRRASRAYSTYSDEEIESIVKRIEGCQARFIAQGGGADRAECLCSIFKEIAAGNGGTLPEVDDWKKMYRKLNCRS
jgi:hypothetical protein